MTDTFSPELLAAVYAAIEECREQCKPDPLHEKTAVAIALTTAAPFIAAKARDEVLSEVRWQVRYD